MGGHKRKNTNKDEEIRRKIRKLEERLQPSRRRKIRVLSSSSEDELPRTGQREDRTSRSQTPPASSHRDEPLPGPSWRDELLPGPSWRNEPLPGPSSSSIVEQAITVDAPISIEPGDLEPSQVELDDEILNLLGEAPKTQTPLGKHIHQAIASRWQEVLSKGLAKESKDKIHQEYLVPGNCDLLIAPVLNPEVKVALTDFMVKRDQSLSQKQQQIGAALAALAQATESLIAKEAPEKVLKPLSDACRLLCDTHFQDTKTRRTFVVSSVKPDLKETLVNTSRDKYLFGEKLTEQIKAAQTIQRSGEGLKVPPKQPFTKKQFTRNTGKNNLNYKVLHRQAPRAERNQPPQRPPTSRNNNPPRNQQYQGQYQGRYRSPVRKTSYRK